MPMVTLRSKVHDWVKLLYVWLKRIKGESMHACGCIHLGTARLCLNIWTCEWCLSSAADCRQVQVAASYRQMNSHAGFYNLLKYGCFHHWVSLATHKGSTESLDLKQSADPPTPFVSHKDLDLKTTFTNLSLFSPPTTHLWIYLNSCSIIISYWCHTVKHASWVATGEYTVSNVALSVTL